MRFRCKHRQQLVLDDANNRKRNRADDEPVSVQLRSTVAPPSEYDRKLPTKRKRVDDSPSPPRRSGSRSGITLQPEVEIVPRGAPTPMNGVDGAADASAFQRVPLPPTGSSASGPTSSTTAASGPSPATDALFLFPGFVAAPRALPPPSVQTPADRMPLGFPAAIAPVELHPVNGLNNNNNNNNESGNPNKMAPVAGAGGGGELAAKMAMAAADRRVALPPFVYRAPNPVVDKMLNLFGSAAAVAAAAAASSAAGGPLAAGFPTAASSLQLAQNWCAKCNTSFRMTSDLVYHMRSHHKREFDPVKRRKDDKLRCDVCGETFRERHHLTRHMTSHS